MPAGCIPDPAGFPIFEEMLPVMMPDGLSSYQEVWDGNDYQQDPCYLHGT